MGRIDNLNYLIGKELESYQVIVDNLDENSDDYLKYKYFIECLNEFQSKVLNSNFDVPTFLFSLLQENYGKYDTKLVFSDGDDLIISKDDIWSFDGNSYLFKSDGKEYRVCEGYNLEYVTSFETLGLNEKEEDGVDG